MIHPRKRGYLKAGWGVAAVAGFNRGNMIGCLPAGKLSVVTLVALIRQLVKYAAGMTGLAVDYRMLTIQRKTRGKMVKGVDVYVFLFKTEIR
jgi:hypothetical protein